MIEKPGYPYRFDPTACRTCLGNCCRGSSGYVWITGEELDSLVAALGITPEHFAREYVRRSGSRLALRERVVNGEHLCCLFDHARRVCLVYDARPEQCRTYPFWEQFRGDPEGARYECPGVILGKEVKKEPHTG